eukprot:4708887-Pyramimonas_sp.AAC.1
MSSASAPWTRTPSSRPAPAQRDEEPTEKGTPLAALSQGTEDRRLWRVDASPPTRSTSSAPSGPGAPLTRRRRRGVAPRATDWAGDAAYGASALRPIAPD